MATSSKSASSAASQPDAASDPAALLREMARTAADDKAEADRKARALTALQADTNALKKSWDDIEKAVTSMSQQGPKLALRREDLVRYRRSAPAPGPNAQAHIDSYQASLTAAQDKFDSAEKDVRSAETALEQAQQNVGDKEQALARVQALPATAADELKGAEDLRKQADAAGNDQDRQQIIGYVLGRRLDASAVKSEDLTEDAYRSALQTAWKDLAKARNSLRDANDQLLASTYASQQAQSALTELTGDPVEEILKATPAKPQQAGNPPAQEAAAPG